MLSKLTWRILQIFTRSRLRKSKNWNFDGILLSKVENLLGIYVSLQRRMMQNLNRNCLSVQNWHEEFDEYWPEHMQISKFCTFIALLTKVYNVRAKKSIAELCLIALRIDVKFEGKLVLSKMTWRIWQILIYRLKNSDFLLEIKMGELNQNKNLKQLDQLDAVKNFYFSMEIKGEYNYQNFLHMFYRIDFLKVWKV